MINREEFLKIEKYILYLYCLMFFISYEILKVFILPMFLIILLRKFLYGEKLNCGNDKLKNYLLIFLVAGIIWNFFSGFDYRASRAFFKISRELILPFYIYPIASRDKSVIAGIIKSLILSLFIMSGKIISNYVLVSPRGGATGFEWVGTTRAMSLMASSMSLGWLFSKNSHNVKIFSFLTFILSVGVMIISNSRAGLIALASAVAAVFLFGRASLKKVVATSVTLALIFVFTPSNRIAHFKSTFNAERTIENWSNGNRVELWKNAIWRIKQHPVMGSGTKNDEDLFEKYANNMPEETKVDKYYKKKMLTGGFNDAHNMYLNMISDNGIFVIMHFVLILGILPYLCFKNLGIKSNINRSLNLGIGASLVSFYTYGMFWSIWRGDWSRTEFWFLVSLLCCVSFIETEDEEAGDIIR